MKPVQVLILMMMMAVVACQQKEQTTKIIDPKQSESPDERFGAFFEKVQLSQIYPDGKTFVDCIPKLPTDTILARYAALKRRSTLQIKAFVFEHFDEPKPFASDYKIDTSQSAAQHINGYWSVLTHQPDAGDNGSIIPLPKPYIVPGGHFREIHYWDSYFIMLGLQAAGKTDMIENMIDDFAYLIDTIGYIPNGNRTYYLGRSEPPFFAAMVQLLANIKGDSIYVKYLPQLRREYNFWIDRLNGDNYGTVTNIRYVKLKDRSLLNRYWAEQDKPRPESYYEDVMTTEKSGRNKYQMYRNLEASAESGWDFSSRWLADGKTLDSLHINDIIPVDLNALLYNLEETLAKACALKGETDNAKSFETLANYRRERLLQYFWNPQSGFFEDYNFVADKQTGILSLAGMYPLFFKIATPEQAASVAKVIERDFLKPGGVVTTLSETGQQWDAPYGWAQLQWITIQALRNYGFNELADTIKQRWVDLNVKVYKSTGKMMEKYNVLDTNLSGSEYAAQGDFGWTNGVLLKLLSEK